ncbi:molybdopterin-dependent oxidoreductase [Streptomyces sp900116325]|uniref:molybdopterin-dependent oxidoreductase n=1 Tax=Streptomyces sp. 900116325 TaxID=3154295 RepID=UPI003317E937
MVPGWIGARSVKWLQRITAQAEPTDNYFQAEYRILPPEADPRTAGPGNGITHGPIAIHYAILQPEKDAQPPCGPTKITGFAFAGDDRIGARVDVSPDGGNMWIHADLNKAANPWTWQHWHATLALPPGEKELVARAGTTPLPYSPNRQQPSGTPGDTPTTPGPACTSQALTEPNEPDEVRRQAPGRRTPSYRCWKRVLADDRGDGCLPGP